MAFATLRATPQMSSKAASTVRSSITEADDIVPVTITVDHCLSPDYESLTARIERLGRERPASFSTAWREALFAFSIAMSPLLADFFISGFAVILPTLTRDLGIPQAASVWPATAFTLVIACTLLVFGRLGDMYGGRPIYLGGLAWLVIWSVVTGFSVDPIMLNICRALQGFGPAAMLPSGVMLIGGIYRPGPRKNLVFAIYGTASVFGFFGGIVVAGLVGQFLHWGFFFWIGAMLTAVALATSYVSIPHEPLGRSPASTEIDWLGAVSMICGLALTVFAITQSAHVPSGWRTPYIPASFALGALSLCVAAYVEIRIARYLLLPGSIFTTPGLTPLLLALFFLYGCWAIFTVYGALYFQNIMHASPLQIFAWYAPYGVAGLLLSILEGLLLHIVPGRVLVVAAGIGALGSQLLLALMPLAGGGYWSWVFPAVVLSTIGIDLATIYSSVFITTALPVAEQGLAGGLLNSVMYAGGAIVLGLMDVLQSATYDEQGLGQSYKNVFWFGAAAGLTSLVLMVVWGKLPATKSDMTADEKADVSDDTEGGRAGGAVHTLRTMMSDSQTKVSC